MPKKRKIWKRLLLGGVAILAAAALVLFWGFYTGAFLSPPDKIMLAAANTLEPPAIVKALEASNILGAEQYTISLDCRLNPVQVDLSYMQSGQAQMLSGGVAVFSEYFEVQALLAEEQLRVKLPFIDENTTLVYPYTEEKSGSIFGEDENQRETFRTILEQLHTRREAGGTVRKTMVALFRGLEFKKLAAKTFQIDKEEVSCPGYEAILEKDELTEIMDELQKSMEADGLAEQDILRRILEQVKEKTRSVEHVTLRFYLYKNQLACMELETDGSRASLFFEGGVRRTENMRLEIDEEEILKIAGKSNDKEESGEIFYKGIRIVTWSYETEAGAMTLEAGDAFGKTLLSFDGSIKSKKGKLAVDVRNLKILGKGFGLEGTLTMEQGIEEKQVRRVEESLSASAKELNFGEADKGDLRQYFDGLSLDFLKLLLKKSGLLQEK